MKDMDAPRNWLIAGYDGNENFVCIARNVRPDDLGDHLALGAEDKDLDFHAIVEVEDAAFVVFEGRTIRATDLKDF